MPSPSNAAGVKALAIVLSLTLPCLAQASLGSVEEVVGRDSAVEVRCQRGSLWVSLCTPEMVRVRARPGRSSQPWDETSIAIEKRPPSAPLRFLPTSQGWQLQGGRFRLQLQRQDARLRIQDSQGRLLLEDRLPITFERQGFRVVHASSLDDHYFGLGDKPGALDRRNQSCTLWNSDAYMWQESTDPLYKSMPFYLGFRQGRCWGLYLDNTHRSQFEFQKQFRDAYSFACEGGQLDYYVMAGPSSKDVLRQYTALLGRMPLPPLWSLGYQQSRGSYIPESAVRQVAQKLRERAIPCDVLYLDGDYKDGARPFTVDRKLFPNFEKLIGELQALHLKTVISLDPYLAKHPGDAAYDQALARGYLATRPNGQVYYGKVWPGLVAWADFANPEVRAWWGGLHRPFVLAGVRGIWDDMNEPAAFYRADKTVPLDVRHQLAGRRTDQREIHNVFGMLNSRATFEGLQKLRPELRPFVLARSGFSGSWRYAATWTGDNSASWNHLRLSVPQLLNLGVSGFSLAGADIGGYSGNPSPALLTRWMQLGALNPLFRNHSDGTTREREPWVDGPEHEAARKQAIELRYRLLPYFYAAMEECSRNGVPLMRPMFLEFPQEPRLVTLADQYMLGSQLLVAPVLQEDPAGYNVQLPKGDWYDLLSGQKQVGPTLKLKPELAEIPIFARAGSILPVQPLVQSCEQAPEGPLELWLHAGASGDCQLYFDDGETTRYQKGDFWRCPVRMECSPSTLKLLLQTPRGRFRPWFQSIRLRVRGFTPQNWTLDGQPQTGGSIENGAWLSPPLRLPWREVRLEAVKASSFRLSEFFEGGPLP